MSILPRINQLKEDELYSSDIGLRNRVDELLKECEIKFMLTR
jgi:hypothetical protein